MKIEERKLCIKLRKENGLSLREIADQVRVSKSSVSLWVRDVELTEEQKKKLIHKNPIYNSQLRGAGSNRETCKKNRVQFQNQGRKMVGQLDATFSIACALYWAEGTKDKNSVRFSNSDPDMVIFFVDFLRRYFDVKDKAIILRINCFTDVQSLTQIERFWLNKLGLELDNLRRGTVNYHSNYSKKKRKNKLPYGTICVMVHSTEIVQKIFGAIQEIGRIQQLRWVE